MGRIAPELSALAVSRLKEPGLHFVGGVPGLALQVLPTGGRTWILRVMVAGKRRDIGMGGFPAVTLAGAREAARQARAKIKEGIDPVEERKAAASKLKADRIAALTFDQCAAKFIKAHKPAWRNPKHGQQWTNTLETYVTPIFGAVLVRDVEVQHVLEAIEPIWAKKTVTAARLRGRIEQVLDWATARGYRTGLNPARWRGHLDKTLPKPGRVAKPAHHPALPIALVPAFMARIRGLAYDSARCLEFLVLTGARSEEARGATWQEIDFDAAIWSIPGTRTKAGTEHRVPLSARAVELLAKPSSAEGADLVFPATKGKQFSDMTLSMVMRRLNTEDSDQWLDPKTGRCSTPHGFRSTFRDWAAERTNYSRELCEVALGHAVAGKTEAAYWRGDLLVKRREMMDAWATFASSAATEEKPHPEQAEAQ